ncbi:hypothetical protein GCM10010503_20820 [Streptomyces lucensis JCM 4490]|uniref:Uncharacterized protein n=1 Tax=Streptomyces lucensis JCM 4490 TaxID=1306176 RepID=A0A918MQB6_9ACTN|nr:hypothetical protein GCM10010503_20820 [Streptomyces lucensis JCM 4490]
MSRQTTTTAPGRVAAGKESSLMPVAREPEIPDGEQAVQTDAVIRNELERTALRSRRPRNSMCMINPHA